MISKVDPRGDRSRWRGEGVGWKADNSEKGILVGVAHRPEELLDVVHCVERMTSGAN